MSESWVIRSQLLRLYMVELGNDPEDYGFLLFYEEQATIVN